MPLNFLRRLREKILGQGVDGAGPAENRSPSAAAIRVGPKPKRRRHRAQRSQGPRREVPSGVWPPSPGSATTASWSRDLFSVPPEEGKVRFHDLDIPDEIVHAVADLGFRYCTPIQAQALPPALSGRHVAGQAPTGTGKTAAFLINIFTRLLRESPPGGVPPGTPRAVVLAPTRELVAQIARDATALGKYVPFRTLAVYGGTGRAEQQAALVRGKVDLVVATPGRLLDFRHQNILRLHRVEILVIDEADRMLDMGFIPDVRLILHSTPPPERRQTLLFSATLAPEVMALAAAWMPDPVVIRTDPEELVVPTVAQRVYAVASRDKLRLLGHLLRTETMARVLVFANRRETAARVADRLKRLGWAASLLSGDVPQRDREKILESFRRGDRRILVATDVAARGLHIEGITHVINYDFPCEPELYVHRIGRTGRVGRRGTAISFACENESFNIPAVEKLLGCTLPCELPDEAWLTEPLVPERHLGRPTEQRQSPTTSEEDSRRASEPSTGEALRASDSQTLSAAPPGEVRVTPAGSADPAPVRCEEPSPD